MPMSCTEKTPTPTTGEGDGLVL